MSLLESKKKREIGFYFKNILRLMSYNYNNKHDPSIAATSVMVGSCYRMKNGCILQDVMYGKLGTG